jgi:RimJ/RimL family protein N-acetyltransferase
MSTHVTELVRPDGRCLVRCVGGWTPDAAAEAVELADRRGALALTHLDERETDQLAVLADAGFVVARRDAHVVFAVEHALEALSGVRMPAGVSIRSAADVEENQLRLLDDELRQDVPGTSGWRSPPEEFREDTFADPAFDPRTYLIAVDSERGELIGLVRIWMNPEGPRLGMVAMKRDHRRRGIGSMLVAQALRAVHAAGAAEVRTEYDLANSGSRALFEGIGARRLRTVLELVYEPRVRESSGVR